MLATKIEVDIFRSFWYMQIIKLPLSLNLKWSLVLMRRVRHCFEKKMLSGIELLSAFDLFKQFSCLLITQNTTFWHVSR